jgi:aerotaxis receptor
MKKNLPVTNVEIDFLTDDIILSTTDPKGAITYVNDSFVKISGFSADELLNKNHNIVRHPEMPPPAFDDLWTTIKTGQPWMGVVKNRCKNGDHYWVDAFVTPIHENGVITEYQSVRVKPKRELVARAESVYKKINAGISTGAEKASLPLNLRLMMGMTVALLPMLLLALVSGVNSPLYLGLGYLFSLVLGYGVITYFLRPLSKVVNEARSVVDNRLMQYIYTGRTDELGQIELAMKMLKSELGAVVGRMSDTSQILMKCVDEAAESISMTNHGVQLQKEELEQATTAMNEMTAAISEVSRSTSSASDSVIHAAEQAVAGKQVVERVNQTTHSLAEGVNKATDVLEHLNQASNEIGSVIDVINGIAEQTNLLALNAAIEAARAGEQGRGFAVVADEVRTLASRTQQSTVEIQKMVEQLQAGAKEAVQAMQQGREYAEQSLEQTEDATQILESVLTAVDSIKNMSVQISSAVNEQSSVAEEINRNIVNINQGAEESAIAAVKTTAIAERLTENTAIVVRLMNEFHKRSIG